MRILIIRHADPDYSIDSLTETGWKEASLLTPLMDKTQVDFCYVSPLGRAQDTMKTALKNKNIDYTVCEWLREFAPGIEKPNLPGEQSICWDWLPQDLWEEERFYNKDEWYKVKPYAEAKIKDEYDWVCNSLDELLARHGYVRDGLGYRVEKENHATLALFCHFGVQCVLLSHLLNISPLLIWHGFAAPPSSVTTIFTEERRQGKASFRVRNFGDISHLYAGNEEPSFSARFTECYTDDQRHD